MHLRTIAAFLAIAVVPALTVAAPAAPPAPILKLTNAVIHATNTDDASAFAGLYADDAVVVDENPPFVWRGAGAGAAWWHVIDAVTKTMKMTHMAATGIRITEFKQSATDAYMIQAMTIAGTAVGKPFAESGTMTYTFHKTGDTWLISSQIWTTKP